MFLMIIQCADRNTNSMHWQTLHALVCAVACVVMNFVGHELKQLHQSNFGELFQHFSIGIFACSAAMFQKNSFIERNGNWLPSI